MSDFVNFDAIDADLNHFDLLFPSFNNSNSDQYYDGTKFNQKFLSTETNDLSLIHLNIRSLQRNGDVFQTFFSTLDLKFDIICLSETWARDTALNNPFTNHNVFQSIRANRQGGGVAIYVHKRFSCSIIPDLTLNNNILESEIKLCIISR